MLSLMRWPPLAALLIMPALASGASPARTPIAGQGAVPDAFTITDRALGDPATFIVYGDMRFTDVRESTATNPGARQALVAKIAAEHPGALLLTGDIPWHGGVTDDYRVYHDETAPWREARLRVYPVLGNHEFSGCAEAQCLENWWQAFPEFRGRRWYGVNLGTHIRALALDSNAPLTEGSPQRAWLEHEIASLPAQVRFVILALHHPPIADEALWVVRSNERGLATYLSGIAPRSTARFLVCGAHVHNYERFEQDGVVYLVSGGGGAKPLFVARGSADQYKDPDFPNFHYVRFRLTGDTLSAEMVRLTDYDAHTPHVWAIKDRFTVSAPAPSR
jgi:3',5'-cyclic AMP phosphodiesterase CpdA